MQHRAREERVLRSTIGDQVVHDGACACGLAPGGNEGGVATEEGNIGLDPLKGGALVVEAGVGEGLGFHGCAGEETVGTELGEERVTN